MLSLSPHPAFPLVTESKRLDLGSGLKAAKAVARQFLSHLPGTLSHGFPLCLEALGTVRLPIRHVPQRDILLPSTSGRDCSHFLLAERMKQVKR